ncbi:MAG: hypothetical protein AABX04_02370 [Nanoarchaeota archaeon]
MIKIIIPDNYRTSIKETLAKLEQPVIPELEETVWSYFSDRRADIPDDFLDVYVLRVTRGIEEYQQQQRELAEANPDYRGKILDQAVLENIIARALRSAQESIPKKEKKREDK